MSLADSFNRFSDKRRATTITLPALAWLGGFMYTWNAPGNTFWDALIWVYYVGRFIAMHFTTFTY